MNISVRTKETLKESNGEKMELIIFSGIQCAGKSTFYTNKFIHTHAWINLDTLKTRKKELAELTTHLESNLPVVIDNTNPIEDDRARYIELAKLHEYRVVGYQFDVPVYIAQERGSKRKNQKTIPDFVISNTASRMKPLTLSEGFDQIFIVDAKGEVISIFGSD